MATKRKLRGLGGSPEQHAHEASVYFGIAASDFRSVQKNLAMKKCRLAYHKLVDGIEALATADRENKWSDADGEVGRFLEKELTTVNQARSKAEADVFQSCFTEAKTSVSGLGRRPSRRRR